MFKTTGGSVRGHDHSNNQDFFVYGQVGDVYYGFVLDGCTGGKHSEVGAQECGHFLKMATEKALSQRTPIRMLPALLFEKLINFIQLKVAVQFLNEAELAELLAGKLSLAQHPYRDAIAEYVEEYWLATVVGFVTSPETVYLFWRGDGAIRTNEVCRYIKAVKKNQPLYPGYFVIPWKYGQVATAQWGFTVEEIDTSGLNLLAIATDSFHQHHDLFNQIHLYLEDRQLPRQLVMWSEDTDFPEPTTANEAFGDDTTVVVLYRQRK